MLLKPILQTWGRTMSGRVPTLSLEVTRECPLRCPGCYAYEDAHLGTTNLRSLADFKGEELITRVLALVDRYKPLHLSIVGGDPLVRFRELDTILPQLSARGIHVQVVTSAFRQIPLGWASIPKSSEIARPMRASPRSMPKALFMNYWSSAGICGTSFLIFSEVHSS